MVGLPISWNDTRMIAYWFGSFGVQPMPFTSQQNIIICAGILFEKIVKKNVSSVGTKVGAAP
jgi:hypothetical protein